MKTVSYYAFILPFLFAGITANSQEITEPDTGTVTDIDGNVYNTVVIGGQEWMAENLRTSRYANGDSIPFKHKDSDWTIDMNGAYIVYPHEKIYNIKSKAKMIDAYGKLYNWHAVNDKRGLCPDGWRVPTDKEWSKLTDTIISTYDNITAKNIGNSLKSCRQPESPLGGVCSTFNHPRWNSHDKHYGTDDFGFSALPAGVFKIELTFGSLGHDGYWWTATRQSPSYAWFRVIYYDYGYVDRNYIDIRTAFSVRCIKKK